MEFYLVTTDHLEDKIWFKEQKDFKVAMNAIPIIAAMLGIRVIAFILMSNHVHFILECTQRQALEFINEFKRHFSYYTHIEYGVRKNLRRNKVDIRRVDATQESICRAIAYVQMNSVAANICSNPSDYPWGIGGSFFRVSKPKGIPLESLSARARYKLLHCKKDIPGGLLIGEDGYILPESYVVTSFVESVFRTPKSMNYYLNNSSKAKALHNAPDSTGPVFKDQTIIPVVADLCQTLYRKTSVKELEQIQQAEILRQLRFRFSSNVNQMARVTGLPYETVVKLLESF